jgi:hypothetical protein
MTTDADGVLETVDIDKDTFAGLLATATHGAANEAATVELKALIAELQRVEAADGGTPKGKLVLTASFAVEKGRLAARFDVTVKNPPKAKPFALLYVNKDGGLTESDPKQLALGIKETPVAPATNVRSIEDRRMAQANDRQ